MPTGDPPGLEPPGETKGKPRWEVGPNCGPVPVFPVVLFECELGVVSADWQVGHESFHGQPLATMSDKSWEFVCTSRCWK